MEAYLRLADLAGSGFASFTAFLFAVSHAMTVFSAQSTFDTGLVVVATLFLTATSGVSKLFAIGAFRNATIHGHASLGKTFEVLRSVLGPSFL